jgi:hypothetical protein
VCITAGSTAITYLLSTHHFEQVSVYGKELFSQIIEEKSASDDNVISQIL